MRLWGKKKSRLEKDGVVIDGLSEKTEVVDVKFSKKKLKLWTLVAVLVILVLLVWQFGTYKKIYALFMPASVDFTVTDNDSKKPVIGATIEVDGMTAKTDNEGHAKILKLSAKNTLVAVTAPGYFEKDQTVHLNRKANSLSITLTMNIEKTDLVGSVSDFVSETVLGGAQVKTGDFTATTDLAGNFEIANLPTGEHTFEITKSGYNAGSQKVTIIKDKPVTFTLTQTGKVYFISNREAGKRGIYTANYDGSNVTRLVTAVADMEDYNMSISPDRTKIAFLSTREKRRNASGDYTPDLFIVNVDGSKLTKLDATFGLYSSEWSADSKYLVWASQPTEKEYVRTLSIYSTKTGKTEKMVLNGSVGSYVTSFDSMYLAWTQSVPNSNPAGEPGLFMRKLTGGDVTKVTDKTIYTISFTDDSKSVRYTYWDSQTQASKYYNYLISTAVTSEYVPGPHNYTSKVASPDKKYYAYTSNRDGKNDVYISNIDGTNEKKITTLGTAIALDWELNSRYIVFDSSRTGESAKYIVDINSGAAKKVTDEYLDGGMGQQ